MYDEVDDEDEYGSSGSDESEDVSPDFGYPSYYEEDAYKPVKKQVRARRADSKADTYAVEICEAIKKHGQDPSELAAFSTGGDITADLGIPAVHVVGVGRLGYPLTKEQLVPLLKISAQAPFGKGKKTVIDVKVRRAWEIDSSLVEINQKWLAISLPKLVTDCCATLGVDAVKMNVKANLYKMLIYEEGGHFKKHRDTEKEPGMFGSLLVQLPADHEGGHLVVEHGKQQKRFPFDVESADVAYFTAFYADCEHTLEPVTKGVRLVLAFNLVREVKSSKAGPLSAPIAAAQLKSFEEVLAAATKTWLADTSAVQKFALPLAHQYTHTNMSFAGLKGEDASTLSFLQDARDPSTKEKLFSVYLALVTKHVSGYSNEEEYGYGKYSRPGRGEMSTLCDIETNYTVVKWMGPEGDADLGELSINYDQEVLVPRSNQEDDGNEDIFGSEPDEEQDEGYCGNYAGTLEYWYYSAVLVFLPAQREFDLKFAADPWKAVEVLEKTNPKAPDFALKLDRLFAYIAADRNALWSAGRLFALTQTAEQAKKVFTLCHSEYLSDSDEEAIVAQVAKYGWSVLGECFTALVNASIRPAQTSKLLSVLRQKCTLAEPESVKKKGTKGKVSKAALTGEFTVPPKAWTELLRLFVANVLASQNPDPEADARSWRDNSHTQHSASIVLVLEQEWPEVCRFVMLYCDNDEDSIAVAKHAGKILALASLNNLIKKLDMHTSQMQYMGHFLDLLKFCTVWSSVNKDNTPKDVIATVDWVVRGSHDDLLLSMQPILHSMHKTTVNFSALVALPSVLEELKKESPMSKLLTGIVQARIAVVRPHAVPPAFSWRMPAKQIDSDDARVGAFLASEQQTISLVGGFGGIVYARKWVTRCLGYNQGARGVVGEAFGSGQNAGVKLAKTTLLHDAAVKRAAEFEAELRTLQKLLRIHPENGAVADAPASKKAKVDHEVIVID